MNALGNGQTGDVRLREWSEADYYAELGVGPSATREEITAGCDDDRYCPDGRVTRGQMATFLARALRLPSTTRDYFDDDDGTAHEANINRLAAAGITGGCGTRQFCPTGSVTRGQMAAFLHRALD